MRGGRGVVCLIYLVLVCAGCVSGAADRGAGPDEGQSHETSSGPEDKGLPDAASPIDLECSSAKIAQTPGGTKLHGVATQFFGWGPGTWQGEDLESLPTIRLRGHKFYQVKSPISISEDASARTRIALLAPANARLYYTDWATWARLGSEDEAEQLNQIATHAASVLSVPRCGKAAWGAPGMLLLEGPACVTFRVAGQNPDWEATRTVAFYKERC
jgi:hypothetical protein